MKRLLYLVILPMIAMTISAPAALAQQGGGLCAGAQAVTSLSGNTSEGPNETEPFNIGTDTFQVAVDNTSGDPEGRGYMSLGVRDSSGATVTTSRFGDGEDGIINVPNIGNGPFTLDYIRGSLQAYDITVYECPDGVAPNPEPESTTPEPTTPDDDMMEPTTPAPTTPEPLPGDTGASEADNGVDGGDGEEPDQDDPRCINGILDRNGDGRISPIEAAQAGADATQGEDPCPGTGDGQRPGDGAGDTGADDEMGSQFKQTWTGPITQTGEDGTVTGEFGVEADIMPVPDMTESLVDEVVGEVSYDSLDCSGVWVLKGVSEDSIQVEEQIEEGVGNCVEFVPITLTPQEDGSLGYYARDIYGNVGEGVLTRQGSSAPDGGMDDQQPGDGQQPAPEDGEEPTPIVDRTGAVTEYVADSVRDLGAYSAGTMADTVGDIRQGRLPDTGGGWTVLLFIGAALVGGGWFLVRRFSR